VLTAAASHSHWYTSGIFYAAASLIALLVIGALTVWATLHAGSTKRRLTYRLADDTPLLARTTALAEGDLEILYQGQRLDQPRVVSVRLESRGRRDIGSDDFDERRPLAIDLGVTIVKRLATEPAPDIPESAIRVEGTRLMLGPCLIRKRQVMSFAFLIDGGQPRLSHQDYLLNVDVRESADTAEPPWSESVRVMTAAATTVVAAAAAGAAVTGALTGMGLSVTTVQSTAAQVVLAVVAAVVVIQVVGWLVVRWLVARERRHQ
jgi:hypothetical protein